MNDKLSISPYHITSVGPAFACEVVAPAYCIVAKFASSYKANMALFTARGARLGMYL